MEGDCIIINGVKYIPEITEHHSCLGCHFDNDPEGCFRMCDVFEDIYDKSVIIKVDGNK